MKKILIILVSFSLLCACWSYYPLKVTRVKDDVKYPYEISIIFNTKTMGDVEFIKHVQALLKESKYWQKKIIIEVRFEGGERLHTGKIIYRAYIFWRE